MDIPAEWQGVLKRVQDVFPGAIIAGGALRDLANNVPIKDVDIFVPVSVFNDDEINLAYSLFEDIELHKSSEYGVKSLPEDKDRDLHAIFVLSSIRYEYEYDIIFGTPEACEMDSFDINICQIAYDGETVHRSQAYIDGIDNQVIAVMNVNRTNRNAARLERIHKKYPHFQTV